MKDLAAERLRGFLEQIERLEEDKAEIAGQVKAIFAAAKSDGFNTKMMRNMLKLRKLEPTERDDWETLRAVYKHACRMGDAVDGHSLSLAPSSPAMPDPDTETRH